MAASVLGLGRPAAISSPHFTGSVFLCSTTGTLMRSPANTVPRRCERLMSALGTLTSSSTRF